MVSIRKYLSRLKYDYFRKKISVNYVVSTGRTGTNFFETFLNNASEKVYCIHEPAPDLFNISIDKMRYKKDSKIILDYIRLNRKKYIYEVVKQQKWQFIESNPNASFLLSEIKSAFPDSRFLIIVRDPRTYVPSALNKSPRGDGINNFYDDTDGRKRINAMDFKDDKYNSKWSSLTRLEKICWYWNKCNEELFNYNYNNKEHSIIVKYEDLFSQDLLTRKEQFIDILSFLKIDVRSDKFDELIDISFSKKNETSKKLTKDFDYWNESEKSVLLNMTQEMRNMLGYH